MHRWEDEERDKIKLVRDRPINQLPKKEAWYHRMMSWIKNVFFPDPPAGGGNIWK